LMGQKLIGQKLTRLKSFGKSWLGKNWLDKNYAVTKKCSKTTPIKHLNSTSSPKCLKAPTTFSAKKRSKWFSNWNQTSAMTDFFANCF
jgi:hypothetical protein